jgi:hypothetical protein
MFTGIVTDMGEVIAMQPAGEGLHRLKIACRYERASIAQGCLDRLLGRLPHGGSAPGRKTAAPGSPPMPPPRR